MWTRPPFSLNIEPGTLNLRIRSLRLLTPRSNNEPCLFLDGWIIQAGCCLTGLMKVITIRAFSNRAGKGRSTTRSITMANRTGADYIKALRDGREVWYA